MSKQPIAILGAKVALDENYLLILTTNDTERNAVRNVVADNSPALIERDSRGVRIGRIAGQFCIHLNGVAGAQDWVSIGSLCRWMTKPPMPKPRFVLVVGFAWGNPYLSKMGDIVVSSQIANINHQRLSATERLRRVVRHESSIGLLENVIDKLPIPAGANRILSGTLASAEIYLADSEARDEIISQVPEVLGGEMEAFDLVRELDVPWLFIKAISDNAGSDVNRDFQKNAAQLAATLLPDVIKLLADEEILPEPRQDAATNRLTAALIGQDIRISRPQGGRGEIVKAMNGHIPRLIDRLSVYSSEVDEDGLLPEVLAVTIGELVQNSFLHGDASYASCSFTETKIIVADDGKGFDPKTLSGDRGGAQAWSELSQLFLNSGNISFHGNSKPSGNIYTFKLAMLSKKIRDAKRHCMIVSSSIHPGPKLSFSEECDTLYYDAIDNFTFSKIYDDSSELIDILNQGKVLFISCRNKRQVNLYSNLLSKFAGPRLNIFIASRY